MIDYDLKVTLTFILTVSTLLYTWWRTRDQNTNARFLSVDDKFKAGSERMDRHDARLASIEQTLRGMPQKDDLHALQLSIERLNGKIDTMAAVMDGNNNVLTRLEGVVARQEEHLLAGNQK